MDLFVRVSNKIAISFYNKLGYTVYRTVLQYYSGEQDDMRKALTMDVNKKSVVPLDSPVHMEASWVSSQLAFAQKQEAMEVVELEEKCKLQDTGVREGFVEESEVEMKGNQLVKWWDEEEIDMEGVEGEKKIIRKRKWAE